MKWWKSWRWSEDRNGGTGMYNWNESVKSRVEWGKPDEQKSLFFAVIGYNKNLQCTKWHNKHHHTWICKECTLSKQYTIGFSSMFNCSFFFFVSLLSTQIESIIYRTLGNLALKLYAQFKLSSRLVYKQRVYVLLRVYVRPDSLWVCLISVWFLLTNRSYDECVRALEHTPFNL